MNSTNEKFLFSYFHCVFLLLSDFFCYLLIYSINKNLNSNITKSSSSSTSCRNCLNAEFFSFRCVLDRLFGLFQTIHMNLSVCVYVCMCYTNTNNHQQPPSAK